MRLYTAFIVLPLVVSLPVAAQTPVPKATKAIDTIEDIEIGMAADAVIAELTKQGYALADPFKDSHKTPTGDIGVWNVSLKDKYLGQFTVEHGRVTSVNPADEDGGTKPYGTGSNNVHHCDHEFARARWLRWFRKGQYERSSPGNL